MSRKGVVAALVVVAAVVIFGYIAFKSSNTNSSSATVTPPVAAGTAQIELAARGEQLFGQFRCYVCHSTTGGRSAGPTLNGLAGSKVKLDTGKTVVADTQYLRQSIIDPDAQIVAGYGPDVMSAATDPFSSQITQEDNVSALVAFIQSLK